MPDYLQMLSQSQSPVNMTGLDPSTITALGGRDNANLLNKYEIVKDMMSQPKAYRMTVEGKDYDVPVQHVPEFLKLGGQLRNQEADYENKVLDNQSKQINNSWLPTEKIMNYQKDKSSLFGSNLSNQEKQINNSTLGQRNELGMMKTQADIINTQANAEISKIDRDLKQFKYEKEIKGVLSPEQQRLQESHKQKLLGTVFQKETEAGEVPLDLRMNAANMFNNQINSATENPVFIIPPDEDDEGEAVQLDLFSIPTKSGKPVTFNMIKAEADRLRIPVSTYMYMIYAKQKGIEIQSEGNR